MGAHELSEEHRILIDEVWLLLREKGRWPTFAELDRRLYNSCDIQAEGLLPTLPPGLLHGIGSGRATAPAENTQIALTAAGVEVTGRGRRELSLFCAVVRHAVDLEREYEPPPSRPDARPTLTAADIAAHFDLTDREDLIARVGALLATEAWGWRTASGTGAAWSFEIDRSVRKFRDVTEIAMYTRAKDSTNGTSGTTAAAAVSPSSTRRLRVIVATALVVAGVIGLIAFLTGEGLDRAEKWVSIAGVITAVCLSLGGLVLGWLTRKRPQAVPDVPQQTNTDQDDGNATKSATAPLRTRLDPPGKPKASR